MADGTSAPPRRVARSVDELLAGATERRPFESSDSKSGSRFERVVIDGEPHVLKWSSLDHDWTMRSTGDLGYHTAQMWEAGLFDALPPSIDHCIVDMALVDAPGRHSDLALLLRDVGPWLVPEGDGVVSIHQHDAFISAMADLHASFWGWHDHIGLAPLANRYLELGPSLELAEQAIGSDAFIPPLVGHGWRSLPEVSPTLASIVLPLFDDPSPLLRAIEATPSCFVHGNWKFGNLGLQPDGRTILLDFEVPGEAPPLSELAWYLALNTARLPESKEDTISRYRVALEARGIDTAGWWDVQVDLCLLGAMVQFGWEKALGGRGAELEWWETAARAALRWL
jgi:hypothetical protein